MESRTPDRMVRREYYEVKMTTTINPNARMTKRVTTGTKEALVLLYIADNGPSQRHDVRDIAGRTVTDVLKALVRKGLVVIDRRGSFRHWHLTPAGLAEANRIDPIGGEA